MQDGSGAATSARDSPDADGDGGAAPAEKPSAPEPADAGTDKTLEGVVQVCPAQHEMPNPLPILISSNSCAHQCVVRFKCLSASYMMRRVVCRW